MVKRGVDDDGDGAYTSGKPNFYSPSMAQVFLERLQQVPLLEQQQAFAVPVLLYDHPWKAGEIAGMLPRETCAHPMSVFSLA